MPQKIINLITSKEGNYWTLDGKRWNGLARYMASQIIEESGWGQKPSGTFNYLGIKAKKGEPYTSTLTTESINGKEQKVIEKFKN